MTARQRSNLLKLATYLESLPRNYKHFDMGDYADHNGNCDLEMSPLLYAAKDPAAFLANCGTVACAVGHGPAAGIKMSSDEMKFRDWANYSERSFGIARWSSEFDFLFDGGWKYTDNHHYGAAARIRFYLDRGLPDSPISASGLSYAPYRKGSRSAKRREIEAVPA